MTTLSMTIGTSSGSNVSSSITSLTTEHDICSVAQTFEVALDPTLATDFDPWDSVSIAINGTNRLSGYVNEVVKGRSPTKFIVRGMDKMKLALEMFVPDTWTSGSTLSEDVEVIGEEKDAGWWIDFWLTQAGITSSGSVETGYTVPVDETDPLVWTYTAVSDIILECLGYAGGGYTVIMDGDGTAQISRRIIGIATHSLTNTLAFSRSEDDSWLRDRAVVFGASSGSVGIVVEQPDDPSGTTRAVALSNNFIDSEATGRTVARAMLDFFDETLDIKRCEIIGDESIWLGHTASISDSWTGYSGTGLITSIETSVDDRGFRQLVSMDEKCGFAWGFANWHIETVDEGTGDENVGTYTSIAIDASNYAHISYYDHTNDKLKYAYEDAGGWHTETVSGAGILGLTTSIALDSDGYPHISYHKFTIASGDELKYAYKDVDGWHFEVVDDGFEFTWDPNCSIVLDASNNPHIAYWKTDVFGIKHAYKNGGGWILETVDGLGTYCGSIALNSDGYPCVSYRGNAGGLRYAYKDVGGWNTASVGPVDSVSTAIDSHLALDSNDCPHIVYNNGNTNDLMYAYEDSGSWNTETVDSGAVVAGAKCSIALDSNNYPHVSYYRDGLDDLKYAYNTSGSWNLATIDSGGDVGRYSSIALDGGEYPHISYRDDTNDNLKHAYWDGAAWNLETVDTGTGYVGEYTSIALDSEGYPHISYYDYDFYYLYYAYKNVDGWHIETVDDTVDAGDYFTSIALDTNDYPHISYYDYDNDNLKYAYKDIGGWNLETVDNTGNVGRYSSLALDGGGYPHISYFSAYPNYNLKYAYKDIGGWNLETVDNAADVGRYSSLALDGGGYPHISYLDWDDDYLKYAYRDGDGWHIETIDTGYVGGYTSIALDGDGYPHISYYDNANHALKYAYKDDEGWNLEIADDTGPVMGFYTSIALDVSGNPHISYTDWYDDDLRYAHKSGDNWNLETIDSEGDVGGYTSIALKGNDPHISYLDSTNSNLKYAYVD